MISSIILVNSSVLLCLVGLSQQSGCFFKFVPKKSPTKNRRSRDAYDFLFNLFLCAISLYYIPHNYVIPQTMPHAISQAMPHAISQTHSSFYPHRVITSSRAPSALCLILPLIVEDYLKLQYYLDIIG